MIRPLLLVALLLPLVPAVVSATEPVPIAQSRSTGPGPCLVRVTPASAAATAHRLQAHGARILTYLPEGAFLVLGLNPSMFKNDGSLSISEWPASRAIRPELAALAAQKNLVNRLEITVIAGFADQESLTQAHERLDSNGPIVSWSRHTGVVPQLGLRIPPSRLPEVVDILSKTTGLIFAETQGGLKSLNDKSVWRCQSGEPQFTPILIAQSCALAISAR